MAAVGNDMCEHDYMVPESRTRGFKPNMPRPTCDQTGTLCVCVTGAAYIVYIYVNLHV